MTSSTITWGDGSSSAGPSATHVYNTAGTYAVTGTASDAAESVQSSRSVVVEPIATLVLQTPAPGVNVLQSLEVKGYASSSIGIAAMRIYIDSSLVYQNALGAVDVYLKVPIGSHQITLQTQDTAGFTYQTAASINVSSNALNTLKGN